MSVESEHREKCVTGALRWNPRVACRTLDETAFILLNSRMIRLNPVGTFIWALYETGATLDAVVARIVDEFETTRDRAAADASTFVGTLVHKELLVPVEEHGRTP